MQPFFNSLVPLSNQFPQQNFQPNLQQGFQNPMQPQLGMVNPQLQVPMGNPNLVGQSSNPPQFMSNPLMGHFNGSQVNPNLPMQTQFFNNLLYAPQQVPQFSLPNMNQLLHQAAPYVPNLLANLQFGIANANNMLGQNFVQPCLNSSPQLHVNSSNALSYPPIRPHQNQNVQPSVFAESQGQPTKNVHNSNTSSIFQGQPTKHVHNSNSSSKRSDLRRNKFSKNPQVKVTGQGFQKSHFRQAGMGMPKQGFSNEHKGKGHYNKIANELNPSGSANMFKEKKRSYALFYTEKEIQQWREERRKNYPSKANEEKKLSSKPSNGNSDEDAKMRCQRLKEILAKQAELGVEVAEIPSHYLAKADGQQVHGSEDNGSRLSRKQQFRNKRDARGRLDHKHNKRRRFGNKKDKFDQNQRFQDRDSSTVSSLSTTEPTLLKKLLSADIKREKHQLLQVFRFITMNSFFKEWPEEPLKYPLVRVKENGSELEVVDEKSLLLGKDNPDVRSKTRTEVSKNDGSNDDEEEIMKPQEEGEIID